jgi:hypothetical protein
MGQPGRFAALTSISTDAGRLCRCATTLSIPRERGSWFGYWTNR